MSGRIDISESNSWRFQNSSNDDFVLYATTPTQRVLVGVSNGIAPLVVGSDFVLLPAASTIATGPVAACNIFRVTDVRALGGTSSNLNIGTDSTDTKSISIGTGSGKTITIGDSALYVNVGTTLQLAAPLVSSVPTSTMNLGSDTNTSVLALGCGSHNQVINVGTGTGGTTINLGGTGDTVNVGGALTYIQATNIQVVDKLITLNKGGSAASAGATGVEFEEDGQVAGYIKTSSDRAGFVLRAPATLNNTPDFNIRIVDSNVVSFNDSQFAFSNGNVIASRSLESKVPSGTPPLYVTSTSQVANLNATLLAGQGSNFYKNVDNVDAGILAVVRGGTGVNTATGTGSVVRTNAPTINDLTSTGNLSANTLSASGQITSTVATGTTPLIVASSTQVANLNATLLAGQGSNFYKNVDNVDAGILAVVRGGTGVNTATGTGSVVRTNAPTINDLTSTGNLSANTLSASGQITSTVATGTTPLIVASSTQVANLNATLLAGQGSNFYKNVDNVDAGILAVVRGGTGVNTATGTGSVVRSSAPTVNDLTSTGNLNADTLSASGQITSTVSSGTTPLIVASSTQVANLNATLLAGQGSNFYKNVDNVDAGILAVVRGGTGVNTATGTGSVVRFQSPTLCNPRIIAPIVSACNGSTMDIGSDDNTSVLALGCGAVSQVINVGRGSGSTTINIGNAGDTVNIGGTLSYVETTNTQIADQLVTLNKGGSAGSAGGAGIEFEENGSISGYIKTTADRKGFSLRTPATASGAPDLVFSINSSNVFSINDQVTLSNGLMGLGASNPIQKLDIAGNVNTSGAVFTAGTSRLRPDGSLHNISTVEVSGQISSSVATGSAPLIVASSTQVANLNATLLAGQGSNFYKNVDNVDAGILAVVRGGTGVNTATGTGSVVRTNAPTINDLTSTGNLTANTLSASGQITSTVATGTTPLIVASSTQVANLNTSFLEGNNAAFYRNATNINAGTLSIAQGGTGTSAATGTGALVLSNAPTINNLTTTGVLTGSNITASLINIVTAGDNHIFSPVIVSSQIGHYYGNGWRFIPGPGWTKYTNEGGFVIRNGGSGSMQFHTGSNVLNLQATMTSNGNFGLGTSTPGYRLDAAGTINGSTLFESGVSLSTKYMLSNNQFVNAMLLAGQGSNFYKNVDNVDAGTLAVARGGTGVNDATGTGSVVRSNAPTINNLTSTGNLTANTLSASGQITSTVATGTTPLIVASSTQVANLNATLLAGQGSNFYKNVDNVDAGVLAVARGGTGVNTATGTGSVVRSSAPTINDLTSTGTLTANTLSASGQITSTIATGTTPLIIASSTQVANLNATLLAGQGSNFYKNVDNVDAGVLAVARGGTGVNTATGTGSVVRSGAPTINDLTSTGNLTADTLSASGQITSTVSSGTTPLIVASSTQVANLNATFLAGQGSNFYKNVDNVDAGMLAVARGGTGVNTATGTGSVVRTNAPTINDLTSTGTLTANTLLASGQITSTVATGTTPLIVASSTQVANLNATLLAGQGSNFYKNVDNVDAGILAVARGGTGVNTATGTGGVVRSSAPTVNDLTSTGNLTADTLSASGQITSTVATGTTPLVVASSTQVANLNASLLEGNNAAFYRNATNINAGTLAVQHGGTGATAATGTGALVLSNAPTINNLTSTGNLTADTLSASGQITSTVAIGTTPLIVASSTQVANLNATLLAGQGSNFYKNVDNVDAGILAVARGGTGTSTATGTGSAVLSVQPTMSNVAVAGVLQTDTVRVQGNIGSTSSGSTLDIGSDSNTSVLALGCGSASQVINVGTGSGATTINLGASGDTVNIGGTLSYVQTTNMQVSDKLITVNKGGAAGSGANAGLEIEEDGAIQGYIKTTSNRSGIAIRTPAMHSTSPDLVFDVPSSNVFTINDSQLVLSNMLVGLGTKNPTQSLDVSGNINASGSLYTNGISRIRADGGIHNVTTVDVSDQITSTLPTGTAPLIVASSTQVANLNATLLAGQGSNFYKNVDNVDAGILAVARGGTGVNDATGTGSVVRSNAPTINDLTSTGNLTANTVSASGQITSTVSTGTTPLIIASSTQVANLNASFLEGNNAAFYRNATNINAGTLSTSFGGTGTSQTTGSGATVFSLAPTLSNPTLCNAILRNNLTTLIQSGGSFTWDLQEIGFNDRWGMLVESAGTGDQNRMSFTTNSTGAVPQSNDARLTIVQGGNIGIGTLTPGSRLDVIGTISASTGVRISGCNSVFETGFGVAGKETNAGKIGYATYSPCLDIVGAGSNVSTRAVRVWERLGVGSNPTEALSVLGNTIVSGNVGIGTTAPTSRLTISGATAQGDAVINYNAAGSTFLTASHPAAPIYLMRAINDAVDVNSNQLWGGMLMRWYSNSGMGTAPYGFLDRQNIGLGLVVRNGLASNVEAVSIAPNGNVGIGTSNPSSKLEVSANGSAIQIVRAITTTSSPISIAVTNSNATGELGVAGTAGNYSAIAQSGDFVIRNQTRRIILQSADSVANVGIVINSNNLIGVGTNNPTERLHVTGNSLITGTVTGSQLVSTGAMGTAPLVVTSSNVVANLNASFLEGNNAAFYRNATNINAGILGVAFGGTGATAATGTGALVLSNAPTINDLTCTGNLTASTLSASGQITSTVSSGTSPLIVASSTQVANLNATLLAGQGSNFYKNMDNVDAGILAVARGGTGTSTSTGTGSAVLSVQPTVSNATVAGVLQTDIMRVQGNIGSTSSGSTLDIGSDSNTSVLALGCGLASQVINVGTGSGATTINLGASGDIVNIGGTLSYVQTTNMQVSDKLITINKGGAAGSGANAGLEIEEDGAIQGYIKTTSNRSGIAIRTPAMDSTSPDVVFDVPSSNVFTINDSQFVLSNARVGLGNKNPVQSLDVSGNINASGSLYTNGTSRIRADGGIHNVTTVDVSDQITSTLPTGTAPLIVASSTQVANLNTTFLAGQGSNFYKNVDNVDAGILAVARGGTGVNDATGTGSVVRSNAPTINDLTSTGNLTADTLSASGQITSTVATDTAPFIVTSSNQVLNLNTTYLAGQGSNFYLNVDNFDDGVLGAARGGTGTTTITGTGSAVLSHSPELTGTVYAEDINAYGTIRASNLELVSPPIFIGTIEATNLSAEGTVSACNIEVTSSEMVLNLNANFLASQGSNYYRDVDNIDAGTLAVQYGGTGVNDATGTGSVVRSNAPIINNLTSTGNLTADTLAASGQITSTVTSGTAPIIVASTTQVANLNTTFLAGQGSNFYKNVDNVDAGTLAVTRGGTGVNTATGSGSVVRSNAPSIANMIHTGTLTSSNISAAGSVTACNLIIGNTTVGTANPLRVITNSAQGITLALPGNNSTPSEVFFDKTSTAASCRSALGVGDAARGFFIWHNGNDRMNISAAGFVGINTTTPRVQLDVIGNFITSNATFVGTATTCNQIISTVPIGTAPLVVTSSNLVTNLNASFLEGNNAAFYRNATNINAGTLAITLGGTGATTTVGSGANVLSGTPTLSNLAMNRTRIWFGTSNDNNHAIYNNSANIDGEGVLDGMKINSFNAFSIRGGTAGNLNWIYANSTGVGIRHTNPTVALDVSGQIRAFNSNNVVETASTTSVANGQTRLRLVGPGVFGSQVNSGGSNVQTRIEMQGYTTRNGGPSVILAGVGDGDWSQHFTISTAQAGGAAQSDCNAVERMRVTNSGFVGIGTNNPSTMLDVNGQIRSGVITGTAPLVVASSTVVTNLNANLLEGNNAVFYRNATNINAGTLAIAYGGTGANAATGTGAVVLSNAPTINNMFHTGLLTASNVTASGQYTSTLATGTAPLVVASSTIVTNLNASLLEGSNSADYKNATNINAGTLAVVYGGTGTNAATGSGAVVLSNAPTLNSPILNNPTLNNPTHTGLFTASNIVVNGQVTSTLSSGTSPFIVASSTQVANLNASLLEGSNSAAYKNATNINAGTLAVVYGGTGTNAATGTGAVVLSNAPAINNMFHTGLLTASNVTASGQYTSTLASGTAPFVVASSTQVASLNASFLEGSNSAAYKNATNINAGTLAAAYGGTGTNAATGSGAVVLSNAPTISAPTFFNTVTMSGPVVSSTSGNTLDIGSDANTSVLSLACGTANQVINLGTGTGVNTINIGKSGDTVNLGGAMTFIEATNLQVVDKLITLNKGGSAGTANDTGIEFEEAGAITGYIRTTTDRAGFTFRAPSTLSTSPDFTIRTPASNVTSFNNGQLTLSNSLVGINISSPIFTLDVNGTVGASGQVTSTVATGTAPLVIASSTVVANLNASFLEGNNAAFYRNATNINAGTLAVALGGTGATGITGTGCNVLALAPTLSNITNIGLFTTSNVTASGQYTSTLTTGTAPLVVASSTVVANLNASLLEGNNAAFYRNANSINTGALATIYGGTGATGTTGTGCNVLAIAPTLSNATHTGLLTASNVTASGQYTSTLATGTAPLVVASSTVVANLNASLLEGNNAAFYRNASSINTGALAISLGGTGATGITGSGSNVLALAPTLSNTTNIGLFTTSNATASGQYTSTLATGTAPLVIASSTVVANLNASFLEGNNAAFYRNASSINTGALAISLGGTGATGITGSGSNVLAIAPTLSNMTHAGLLTASNVTASGQYTSTLATGTAPLVIASSTVVANLNASLLEGNNAAFYRNATNINAGTLAVAQGGTGTGTATGTGSVVRSDAPTLSNITNIGLFATSNVTASGQYISTLATGTAPLVVASSTVVANLNASLLEGNNAAFYRNATNINTGTLAIAQGGTGTGVATGTGALVLSNNPFINNLNATGSTTIDNLSISSRISYCNAEPGDMIVRSYTGSDRYGMGHYTNGVTRLFASCNVSSTVRISSAIDSLQGSNAGFTDHVVIKAGIPSSLDYGFVGIGTNNPTSLLHVQGDAVVAGTLVASNLTACNLTLSNLTSSGNLSVSSLSATGQITSTLATGTAPLVVASSTVVANLNASFLEGNNAAFYRNASSINTGALAIALGGTGATGITGSGSNVLALAPTLSNTTNIGLFTTSNVTASGQYMSTLATGTAPLVVASSTVVANLNASFLEGNNAAFYRNASSINTGALAIALGGTGATGITGSGSNVLALAPTLSNTTNIGLFTTSNVTASGQYTSTLATGTAPLVVASSTQVANLNASFLEGNNAAFYRNATNINAGILAIAQGGTGATGTTGSGSNVLALAPTLSNTTNIGLFTTSNVTASGQYTSTLATGTAPLIVASSTQVANLNASFLEGNNAAFYRNATNINTGALATIYGGTGATGITGTGCNVLALNPTLSNATNLGLLTASNVTASGQYTSTVAMGTTPFVVASSNVVANLNASFLEGNNAAFYRNAGNINAGILAITQGGTGTNTATGSNNLVLSSGPTFNNLAMNRTRVWLSAVNDNNHTIYNNGNNVDGEGALDGIKINSFNAFSVRGGTAGNANWIYANSTGVGIRNTNPAVALDVTGTISASTGVRVAGCNAVFEFGFGVAGKEANAGRIGYATFSPNLDIIGAGSNATTRAVRVWDRLGVGLYPTEALSVSGNTIISGNVGIGTTTPTSKLTISGATAQGDAVINYNAAGSTFFTASGSQPTAPIYLMRAINDAVDVNSNQLWGGMLMRWYNGTGTAPYGFPERQNIGLGLVVRNGLASNVEALSIGPSGFIGIGVSNPSTQLDVIGDYARISSTVPTNAATLHLTNANVNPNTFVSLYSGQCNNNPAIVYSSSNSLAFGTWSNITTGGVGFGWTERMRLTNVGFLGIGTANPSTMLDVNGQIRSGINTGTSPLVVASSTQVANLNTTFLAGRGSNYYRNVDNMDAGTLAVTRGGTGVNNATGTGSVVLSNAPTINDLTCTGNLTANTLLASGQITSTVSSGTSPLIVSSSTLVANLNASLLEGSNSAAYKNANNINAGTLGVIYGGTGATSTTGTGANVLANSPTFQGTATFDILNFTGQLQQNGGPYIGSQFSNVGSNVFLAAPSNLGIGTSTPSYTLDVNGTVNATDVVMRSDRRLKSEFDTISNALHKVRQLTGYTFNMTGKSERAAGLIAQEVQSVLPEAVTCDNQGLLSIAYGNVLGLIIESIKELDCKLDALAISFDEHVKRT